MNKQFVIIALSVLLGFGVVITLFLLLQPTPLLPRRVVSPGADEVRTLSGAPPAEERPLREKQISGAPQAEEARERLLIYELFGLTVHLPPLIVEELGPILEASKRIFMPEKLKTRPVAPLLLPLPALERPSLTPEQVFQTLYPEFYRSVLSDVQEVLISLGVIDPVKPFKFLSESEITEFNDIFFGYLRNRGAMTEEDYQGYLEGRALLFDRPYAEKYAEAQKIYTILQHGLSEPIFPVEEQGPKSFELLPEPLSLGGSRAAAVCQTAESEAHATPSWPLYQLLSLVISEAKAIEVSGGIVCFRSGGVAEVTAGVNFSAPCCKCSIKKTPVGCLNICSGPAIWDPITKICGCNL